MSAGLASLKLELDPDGLERLVQEVGESPGGRMKRDDVLRRLRQLWNTGFQVRSLARELVTDEEASSSGSTAGVCARRVAIGGA